MKNYLRWVVLVCVAALGTANADPQDPVARAILKIAAPEQKKLEGTLKKDAALDKDLRHYEKSMQQIANNKQWSSKQKKMAMRELRKKHESLFQEWFKKSAIDEDAYRTAVAQYFKKLEIKTKRKYTVKYLGFLGFQWRKVPINPVPIRHDKEIVVNSFDFVEREQHGLGHIRTEREYGIYEVDSEIVAAGAFENIGGLGHFLQMDDRYNKIEVAAALPETQFELSSVSALLGASGASAISRIEVLSDNQIVCLQEIEHASIIAPALWWADAKGADNIVVSCQFDAPEVGDEVLVRYKAVTGVWAVGASLSMSWVQAAPRDIRIRLKY